MARVGRMINSFQNVTKCCKKTNEELGGYIYHFRSLVNIYLENANETPSSETGNVLEINLLNKSALDENKVKKSHIRLLAMVKARASSSLINLVVNVCANKLEKLKNVIANKRQEPAPKGSVASLTTYKSSCEDLFIEIIYKVRELTEAPFSGNTNN